MISLWDLGVWLAVLSIIMLVTSEVLSPRYGKINMFIEFRKMRRAAIVLGISFLLVTSLNIMYMMNA
jgi:hypothetical protein